MPLGRLTERILASLGESFQDADTQNAWLRPIAAYVEALLRPYFYTLLLLLLAIVGLLLWLLAIVTRAIAAQA